MSWLFHPDDLDGIAARWASKCTAEVLTERWPIPLGSVVVFRCFCLERGHIQDTDHPELGAPTFAAFGEAYAKVMEDERRAFCRAVEALGKAMAPMRPLPFPAGPGVTLDLDDKAS